ncbi:MAG TPA: hypothetical protein VEF76_07710 [Patescibacteria group bacterium]|nr:hypothetical protein [Patescibacteria group bacterium]
MKIDYYRGRAPNFGDELNPWLWPRILPGFFDEDPATIFLGIGSIIGEKSYPAHVRKIVFGAGFVPEYHARPDVTAPDWKVYFVRGPRSAAALGLPAAAALGDPGILTAQLVPPAGTGTGIAFMPHWESMERGRWPEACAKAGIALIDPRRPVAEILPAIQQAKTLLCEAMHGAIVADALRVPWIPLMPLNPVHRNKWFDWADTLSLNLARRRLWPSSWQEARLSVLRAPLMGSRHAAALEERLVALAGHRLQRLAKTAPMLSDDKAHAGLLSRMLEQVDRLRRDDARG